jgi:hypothetical protein
MKPETKLALRRRLLMMLRAIVWHADEWLHRQELQLREECAAARAPVTPTRDRGDMVEVFGVGRVPPQRRIETFQQWEARRSGVAPVAKKSRRRGLSAAEFDLRFAR